MNYKKGQRVVVETYGRYEVKTEVEEKTGKKTNKTVYIPKYQVGEIEDILPGKIRKYILKMESGKELKAWNSKKELPRIKCEFHEGNII